MSYRWAEHTGELELEIEAATEEDVFAEALRAFLELVDDARVRSGEPDRPERRGSVSREIRVSGDERALRLVRWLDELEYLVETEGFVPERATRLRIAGGVLVARVHGHRGAPPHLVKGATYHRLAFEPVRGGFLARVVLDV